MEVQEIEGKTIKKDYFQVTPDVWGMRIVFVNVFMIAGGDGQWVLIDAGLKGSAGRIKAMAAELFGENHPPAAIILTHGHFDHVGALKILLEEWTDVPVYAHSLELPYLTGLSSYPPPDPLTGGGLMSWISFVYPKKPINISSRIHALDKSGGLPVLTEWQYVHTPGHAPGHISLFRHRDGLLIGGDAFVTTQQESAFSVATQKKVISGPPKYFTNDWIAAASSVKALWKLHPKIAATGHGKPMRGEELTKGLNELVAHFDKVAVPAYGRYVKEPAKTNKKGVQYLPPEPVNILLITSLITLAGLLTYTVIRRSKK